MRDDTAKPGDVEEEKTTWKEYPVTLIDQGQLKDIISNTEEHKPDAQPRFDVQEVSSNPDKILFHEMEKKFNLDQAKTEKIVEFLQNKKILNCKGGVSAPHKPQFTWFGVQSLEPGVAQSLALHGNPFGGSDIQTRSLNKNKSRKPKWNKNSPGRGKAPAWFDDFVL